MLKGSFVLSKTGRSPVEQGRIISHVLAGDVVLMKGALRAFGVHEQISLLTLKTIEDQCGAPVAAEVARCGFEGIHRALTSAQVENLFKGVRHRLLPNIPPVIKAFGERLLDLRRPFYININCVVRFFVPHALVHCPWHNVSFDPATGASVCSALKPLKTHDLPVERVYEALLDQ